MSPLDFAQDRGVPLALLDGQNKNHEIDSIQSSDSSIPEHAQLRASEATAEEREPSISAIRPIGDSTPSARSSLTIHEAASDQATALPQQTARFASKELLCPWFPEADPEHKRAQTWRVRLSRRKTTLSLACVTAWVVFAINVVATISLPARDHNAVLYTGECKTASRIDSGLHILINFLASMVRVQRTQAFQLSKACANRCTPPDLASRCIEPLYAAIVCTNAQRSRSGAQPQDVVGYRCTEHTESTSHC